MIKIQELSSRFTLVCFFIFTTIVLALSTRFFVSTYIFKNTVSNVAIIASFFVFISLYTLLLMLIRTDSRYTNAVVLAFMLLLFTAASIEWLRVVPQHQISDFGNFWYHAQSALKGVPLFHSDNDYFAKYAYQSGFMIYVMIIVKIFGTNIFAMQMANIVVQVLILLMTYLISNRVFHDIRVSRLSVLLLSVNLDWFALSSQADNQYLGSLLFLIALYLLLINKYWSLFLSGIVLSSGWIIRPVGPVVFMGAILFLLIFFLKKPKLYSVLKIALFAMTCFVILSGTSLLVQKSGLNPYGLKNYDTQWKFIAGLNYQSHGMYSADLDDSLNASSSRKLNKLHEKVVLNQQIRDLNEKHQWLKLFVNKISFLWARNSEAISFTQFNSIHTDRLTQIVTLLGFLGSFMVIIFSWIGSYRLFKIENVSPIILFILPVLGFALVELIIEVQGRYRIEFIPIISMIAGVGLFSVYKTMVKPKRNPLLIRENKPYLHDLFSGNDPMRF